MNLVHEVLHGDLKKAYLRYLIPSLLACITNSIYCLADVYFISISQSGNALAALNICMPLFSLYSAIGLTFGVGGAAIMSIAEGQKNQNLRNQAFSYSVVGMGLFGLLIVLIGLLFPNQCAYLLGSDQALLPDVLAYFIPINTSAFFFVFHYAGSILLRNDHAIKLAMISSIGPNLLNIFLDYLFCVVFQWGISGAAIATGFSAMVGFIVMSMHFVFKKNSVHFVKQYHDLSLWKRIIQVGISSGVLEISIAAIALILNYVIMAFSSALYLSAYAIVSNIAYVVKGLLTGFAQALQPMISLNHGAKQYDRSKKSLKIAIFFAFGFAFAVYLICLLIPKQLAAIFANGDYELIQVATHGIVLYFPCILFMSVLMMLLIYMQACEQGKIATTITFLKGFVLMTISLFALLYTIGIDAIFLCSVVSEALALLFAILFIRKVTI